MDPVVIVQPGTATVAPGGQASVTVTVRNPGATADRYQLDLLGDAASWSHVTPAVIDVPAEGQGFATVSFAPPDGAATTAASGQLAFGVRVRSLADPTSSSVAEGDLVLGHPGRATVTLKPEQSKGWRSGEHRLEVSNWSGGPAQLQFEANHVSKAFAVTIAPPEISVPVGGRGSVEVTVKPRSTFVWGHRVRHGFQIIARNADNTQTVVDGRYEQRPLIGRLPLIIGLGAIVAVLALVAVAWLAGLSTGGDDDDGDANGDDILDTTGPPATPADFVAEAVSSDLVHLSWTPVPDADSYSVLSVDPATANTDEPATLQSFDGVPTTQGGYDAVDLTASTEYCFQVVAVRGSETSARPPAQCVETLAVSETGGPTGVAVEAVDSTRARVRWTDGSGGQSEHLVRQNGPVVAIAPPGRSDVVVDLDPGENCFRVQSRSAGTTSAATEPQCVAGPTETTTPPDLDVIAVVDVFPAADPQAQQRANQRRDELRNAGHAADVLSTADYPRLRREEGELLYVYIGGFTAEADALAYCQTAGLACQPAEPGAPGG